MRVESKVQWRTQDIGKPRNIECLRKAVKSEQNQPKRKAKSSKTTISIIVAEPPNSLGVPILPQFTYGAEYGITGLNDFSAGFQSYLGHIF